ncbi:MAG: iron-sulfur cluster assembly scaffold protein [Woeseiaceae bacterium]|nr:iron-sulfur cluster assembly scaffold protein [Woeseiaceae bacterium]
MTSDPYSKEVRRLFKAPAHAGIANGPSARIDAQGVSVELSVEARNGQVEAARFRAKGCPHLVAAAEAFCADLEGQPVAALETQFGVDIMRRLSVPVEKTGRILVLEDTSALLAGKL